MRNPTRSALALGLLFVASLLAGCTKDADPNAKIDAPGYYNGPKEAKGANAAPADK